MQRSSARACSHGHSGCRYASMCVISLQGGCGCRVQRIILCPAEKYSGIQAGSFHPFSAGAKSIEFARQVFWLIPVGAPSRPFGGQWLWRASTTSDFPERLYRPRNMSGKLQQRELRPIFTAFPFNPSARLALRFGNRCGAKVIIFSSVLHVPDFLCTAVQRKTAPRGEPSLQYRMLIPESPVPGLW